MKTTLNRIREHHPCSEGWEKLLKRLGKTKADDEPLSLITILDSNGLEDALWCLRAVAGYDREIRLFAVACARDVQHLMRDEKSIAVLDVAERYADGKATKEELKDAADAASAARDAAWYAAYALDAASAAWAAASAARDAAWYAAWAAASAARNAAWDAALDAIRSKQEQRFREMILKLENTGA